ncbi:2-dehydropantoate 2-reductase N-terminal domain-containing protein [soil metagenome]
MAVITILGAGVMGTAMCWPASANGHDIRLVGTHLDGAIIASIRESGKHQRLGVVVPQGVTPFAHDQFAQAFGEDSDLLILGVGSAGVGWAIDRVAEAMRKPVPILMITKGLAPQAKTIAVLPDVVQVALKARTGFDLEVAAVGGPCIAGELAVRRQTGVVIVSRNIVLARRLCGMLAADFYHPRPSADLTGVEICAAFKNFFAIAVGWAAGHFETSPPAENKAFNFNAAAILFDQAVREMMVLVRHFGGDDESVWGMPGAGDLYVTCQAGRNSRLGRHLGLGLSYGAVKDGPMKGETIEGAELGVALGPVLLGLIAAGALDGASLPLTRALLTALMKDEPLAVAWDDFHRSSAHA